MNIDKSNMKAKAYIERTREYVNYLEEHINNVHKAFCEVSEKCKDVLWVINIGELPSDRFADHWAS